MSALEKLLEFWEGYDPEEGLHQKDKEYFAKEENTPLKKLVLNKPIKKTKNKKKIHSKLIAQPYYGNIKKAHICFLFLNPGFDPDDYDDESEETENGCNFRGVLIKAIKQEEMDYPFYPLNPELKRSKPDSKLKNTDDPRRDWTGARKYWESKLKSVIKYFKEKGLCEENIRNLIQKEFCVIELFPYHSKEFGIPDKHLCLPNGIPSVNECRKYVDELSKDNEKLIIILRKSKIWKLEKNKHILINGPKEARSGTIGPHIETIYKFLEDIDLIKKWKVKCKLCK
jgi:hypothetical protein